MGEAQTLKDNYDKAMKELQNNCPHNETEWALNGFEPGHYYGKVKICLNCWKALEYNYDHT